MSDAPEVAAYVAQLEAMLRPVAERAGPEHATRTLIQLLQMAAWQHDQSETYSRAEGRADEARAWALAARAIRARVIELRRVSAS